MPSTVIRIGFGFVAASGLACIGVGVAHAGVNVSGTACKNLQCCTTQFLFDSGASQTLLSRACANTMGLLADANGDGTPDAASGSKSFNGGEVETWCFDSVALASTDSAGNICVTTTTVYVSKNNDSWATSNLLGKPWQDAVDACYRAKTNTVTWPWEPPPPQAPAKPVVPKQDTKTNQVRPVLEDVVFFSGLGGSARDMVIYSGAAQSMIPQSLAFEIGAPIIGSVDLAEEDPNMLARLSIGEQNQIQQTVFPVALVQGFQLGLGFPGQPLTVLLLNDLNSDFGVLGADMLQGTDGINEYLYIIDDQPPSARLVFAPVASPGCPNPGCESGDLDGDCVVGLADLSDLLENFGCSSSDACYDANADIDGDGSVGLGDLSELIEEFGTNCN